MIDFPALRAALRVIDHGYFGHYTLTEEEFDAVDSLAGIISTACNPNDSKYEDIKTALRVIDHGYFGHYMMTEEEFDAIDSMIECAYELLKLQSTPSK